ncbi:hypothetical protein JW905_13255, partial [bacterium]|nr:hypothetical protein [candidate division CSSED10-310 bacterium]
PSNPLYYPPRRPGWHMCPGDGDWMSLWRFIFDCYLTPTNPWGYSAEGIYVWGSRPAKPCYVGYNDEGAYQNPPHDHDPGGGNFMFAGAGPSQGLWWLYDMIQDTYGNDKFIYGEGVGEALVSRLDVVLTGYGLWPVSGNRLTPLHMAMYEHQFGTPLKLFSPAQTQRDGIQDYTYLRPIPVTMVLFHDKAVIADGQFSFFPGVQYHPEWTAGEPAGWEMDFYMRHQPGNGVPPGNHTLAYNAEFAYTFAYGCRHILYDVDKAVDAWGNPTSDDITYTLGFLYESEAGASRAYLDEILDCYRKQLILSEDTVADHLFFGRMLHPFAVYKANSNPPLSLADRYLYHDHGMGSDDFPDEAYPVEKTATQPIITSSWFYDPAWAGSTSDPRVAYAMTNFSVTVLGVETAELDVRNAFESMGVDTTGKDFFIADYHETGAMFNIYQITDPSCHVIQNIMMPPRSCRVWGVWLVDQSRTAAEGDETILFYCQTNSDGIADRIQLETGRLHIYHGTESFQFRDSGCFIGQGIADAVGADLNHDELTDFITVGDGISVFFSDVEGGYRLAGHIPAVTPHREMELLSVRDGVLEFAVDDEQGLAFYEAAAVDDATARLQLKTTFDIAGMEDMESAWLSTLEYPDKAHFIPDLVVFARAGDLVVFNWDTGVWIPVAQLRTSCHDGRIEIANLDDDDDADLAIVMSNGDRYLIFNDGEWRFRDQAK